jgi:hypothetical protein
MDTFVRHAHAHALARPGWCARSSRGPLPKLGPAASKSVRAIHLSNVTAGCPAPSTPPLAKPPFHGAFGSGTQRAFALERAASPRRVPRHRYGRPLPAPGYPGRQPGCSHSRANTPYDDLHGLVRRGWAALQSSLESVDRSLPAYVRREVERYLACGDPMQDFAWLACPEGHHHRLVPFSTQTQPFCRSCCERRMAGLLPPCGALAIPKGVGGAGPASATTPARRTRFLRLLVLCCPTRSEHADLA